MTQIEVPKDEISELRRSLLEIETILQIITEKPSKESVPLIRKELSKHMQNMDTRYLNLVKKLDDL